MTTRKISKRTRTHHAAKSVRKTPITIKLLEAEVRRLQELLEILKKKSYFVRRSLAYIEREQRKVMKQIRQARMFLARMKKRGIRTLQLVPKNLEGLYGQFRKEIEKFSKYLIS